ncbi:prepilin peptidase [Aliiroseovarius sp. KMU-50]|uniref:Prepilin peptidase n=1 Tax=Aliiroseovarius salicola TaxID=3009082 RepID=A0ABT4VXW5_9RHOB|nr:prepilin peptidase [Aliiroseovarius sp. KMU-50]MDA5093106.1 prepilin peptidase [Aliiroseovarius sp. KMU-50]
MLDALNLIAVLSTIAWLLRIAYLDFRTLKIRNRDVVILLGLFFIWAATNKFHAIQAHLIAGAVMFVIGYVFWTLKLMGGGDAKLFLPAGLFVGWSSLGEFAIALLVFSVIFLLVIRSGLGSNGSSYVARRLTLIRDTSNVPYGVPITLSVIVSTNFW